MSTTPEHDRLLELWHRLPTEFAPGLTDSELEAIESANEFRFPPDLRACLASAMPTGKGFPNWRSPTAYQDRWEWIQSGIDFDIRQGFWYERFGPRPDSVDEQIKISRAYLKSVPKLVPVFVHQMLPTTPCQVGNPIFSIWQTDAIYYGEDLAGYLEIAFFGRPHNTIHECRLLHIDFWTNMVEIEGWDRFDDAASD